MLAFFQKRAIPAVEFVEDGVYRRSVRINDSVGWIAVTHVQQAHALVLETDLPPGSRLEAAADRVRRMFDLDADMDAIHQVLGADPALRPLVRKWPGLRLPGAWAPFETAVRAVVGQQISVGAARTIIGRVVSKAGPLLEPPVFPEISRLFPTAQDLLNCDLGRVGMPAKRTTTLKTLAEAVAHEKIRLAAKAGLGDVAAQLTRIAGIGDWTAQYIAMRALGERDAFPAGDLGICRALAQNGRNPSAKQVRLRAADWRPYRAYAAVYLWHA
jgi:3-methyladenine DNA glycosylase/8-oxoguanine DNA glycosylase